MVQVGDCLSTSVSPWVQTSVPQEGKIKTLLFIFKIEVVRNDIFPLYFQYERKSIQFKKLWFGNIPLIFILLMTKVCWGCWVTKENILFCSWMLFLYWKMDLRSKTISQITIRIFSVVLGFEFRASHLLGRYFTTPQVLFLLVILGIGSHFFSGPLDLQSTYVCFPHSWKSKYKPRCPGIG
jgi:hypothetical protein